MATQTWRVKGYVGWSDYDGPSDNNLDFEIEMDSSITKEELMAVLQVRYKKHRVVSLSCEKVYEKDSEIIESFAECKHLDSEDISGSGVYCEHPDYKHTCILKNKQVLHPSIHCKKGRCKDYSPAGE